MAGMHISGPFESTAGLTAGQVTANAIGAAAVIGTKMGSGAVTGRAMGTGSGGPLFAVKLDVVRGTLAAGSGTIQMGWRWCTPNRPTFLREINTAFARGGSAPGGGNWRFKVWSGTTSKGLAGTAIAGAATFGIVPIGGLAITLPARTIVGFAVHTVGATVAGGGGEPTLYYTHR